MSDENNVPSSGEAKLLQGTENLTSGNREVTVEARPAGQMGREGVGTVVFFCCGGSPVG